MSGHAEEEGGDDDGAHGGSDDEGKKKKPSFTRQLKGRLSKLVERTDDESVIESKIRGVMTD
jgi:hypothetical protein